MNKILNYIKSISVFFISIIILTFITTIIYYFNFLTSNTINYIKMIIPLLSLIISGSYLGNRSSNKGWLEGLKFGLIIVLILIIISFLAFNSEIKLTNIIYYLIMLITSIMGSMFGIGFRK